MLHLKVKGREGRARPIRSRPGPAADRGYFGGETHYRHIAETIRDAILRAPGHILITGPSAPDAELFARTLKTAGRAQLVVSAMRARPRMEVSDFLRAATRALGVEPAAPGRDQLWPIAYYLMLETRNGRSHVLLIEDADTLSEETILQIHSLATLDEPRILNTVLLSTPALNERLRAPDLGPFLSAVTARIALERLLPAEIASYIAHELGAADGYRADLFPAPTLDNIAASAGGDAATVTNLARGILRQGRSSAAASTRPLGFGDLEGELREVVRQRAGKPPTLPAGSAGNRRERPSTRWSGARIGIAVATAVAVAAIVGVGALEVLRQQIEVAGTSFGTLAERAGLVAALSADGDSTASAPQSTAAPAIERSDPAPSIARAAAEAPITAAAPPPAAPAPAIAPAPTVADAPRVADVAAVKTAPELGPAAPDSAPETRSERATGADAAGAADTASATVAREPDPVAVPASVDAVRKEARGAAVITAAVPALGATPPAVMPADTTGAARIAAAAAPSAAPPRDLDRRRLSTGDIEFSVKRGVELLNLADIASARKFFEYAAEAGDARAARGLAETYDPQILRGLNVRGATADEAKAEHWYREAVARGDAAAKSLLQILKGEPVE